MAVARVDRSRHDDLRNRRGLCVREPSAHRADRVVTANRPRPPAVVGILYTVRMTHPLSFRADAALAKELDAAAAAAGVPRSDLLNQALRELLYRLRCERDADKYAQQPLTPAEAAAWPNEAWPDDDTDWTEVFGE